jgi:hypothetical protein
VGAGGAWAGAIYGAVLGGSAGLVIGAVLGAYSGLTVGILSWMFDGPGKGALRCGAGFAAVMGLIGVGVVVVSDLGQAGFEQAATVVVLGVATGGIGGALLGAFVGWLAGPIFQEMVRQLDAGGPDAAVLDRDREVGSP